MRRFFIIFLFTSLFYNINAASLVLTWTDNSSNEDGFNIERKTGAENFTQIATVGENIVTYTDDNLNEGISYTYRVNAYNVYGISDYSNEASATTSITILPAPQPIASLSLLTTPLNSFTGTLYTIDSDNISIEWSAAENASYYEIQIINLDKNIEYPIITSNITTAIINRQGAGHFSIKIRPVNESGTADWTDSKIQGWILYWKLAKVGDIIIE